MEYCHITTIRKDINKQPDSDAGSFIRKASFAAETEASLDEITSSELSSVRTLAGNLQGGTFAQRARAAELQAARARKLKRDPQASPSPPREVLTLKMPRRKWTPLDLSTQDMSTRTSPETSSIIPEINSSANVSEQPSPNHDYHRMVNELIPEDDMGFEDVIQDPKDLKITQRDHYSSRLYGSKPNAILHDHDLSEYPAALGARISNNDVPQLDYKFGDSFQMGLPSIKPLPILNSGHATQEEQDEMNRLYNQQNNQIAELQAQLGRNNAQHGFNDPFAQPHSSIRPGPSHMGSFQSEIQSGYSSSTTPYFSKDIPKPAVGKNYPAVKGTPAALDTAARLAFTNPPPSTVPQNTQGHVPRKPSAQEKDILMRHLINVGDQGAHQQSRTGMNFGPHFNGVEARPFPSLLEGSQPLPWKDRLVPILPPPGCDNPAPYNSRHQGIWAPEHGPHSNVPFTPAPQPAQNGEKVTREQELNDWWTRDNRVPIREKMDLEAFVRAERAAKRPQSLLGGKPEEDGYPGDSKIKDPSATYTDEEMLNDLLIPVMANLLSYKNDDTDLNHFRPPPSWAIDHTPSGNNSFFSSGWGQPPQRVGRDPRYRAMQHDGRSSVFEDPTGRFPREEFSHGRGRWNY